jgi:hypothetical protein
MPVIQNWESAEGRERWKWEHTRAESHPSDPMLRGLRPESPQAYPAMMYRVMNRNPLRFESHEVASEVEQRNLESRGFVAGGQGAAVEEYERREQSVAVAATERAYHEQRMSPKAQAEAEAVDLTTIKHLGEIPETPVRRPVGRPRKEESA